LLSRFGVYTELVTTQVDSALTANNKHSSLLCATVGDIENTVLYNFIQKKGLFRRKLSVKDILSWTEEPIRKPLTCISEKSLKKDAVESFKLVQIYMGDRKAKQGMTVNSVALDIATLGYQKVAIRDEIYVQVSML
jgi:hypothetical protein